MPIFELVIVLLLAGSVLVMFSARIGVPYPALLSLAGAAAALVPGVPEVVLDPRLMLVLFVAPTLLDAAYDSSPRDMRANWLPIAALAIVVVVLTVAAVAWLVHGLVPGLSWPAPIVLGAVVAPPDAAAATAVLRQLRLPHRLMVILQGESLLNDASALLIFRFAVSAAMGTAVFGWEIIPSALVTIVGGGVLGWVLARVWLLLPTERVEIALAVVMQFLGTFAVWILAEWLEVSAIMTVVVYAMTLARRAGIRTGGRRRIAYYAVWEVAVFVLNVLAFVLIGLQLRAVITRVDGEAWAFTGVAVAVCATVIAVRVVWTISVTSFRRWLARRAGNASHPMVPTAAGAILVSWCGMRGIVTLASALALPEGFEHRDLIVFCAFAVVLGTLAVQGLSLRPLLKVLNLPEDSSVLEEARLARRETAHAALKLLEELEETIESKVLRREYAARANGFADGSPTPGVSRLQDRAVAAQREVLVDLRRRGTIGDDAYHTIEEELDIIELTSDPRVRMLEKPE